MIIDLNRSIDNRYEKHIDRLKQKNFETENIEETVGKTITSLKESRSIVIYGEPQSGKTEMMISLTARLLDEGHKIIIILLNDSISLLNQNLERFSKSGLSPSPKNFTEILSPEIKIGDKQWVVFSKKNAKDLRKLKDKLHNKKSFVIIDDEADYATPNAKINQEEKTRINELVGEFLSEDSIYIGVTATPARLDLNNTFNNDKDKWVCFEPHSFYRGHEVFFPKNVEPLLRGKGDFHLTLLKSENESQSLRKALFSFLVNIAYLNLYNNDATYENQNYSFLIHTSGKKDDHERDAKNINSIFNILTDTDNSERVGRYYEEIHDLSVKRFGEEKAKKITKYIHENADRYRVIIMNSDQEKTFRNNQMATKPVTLFTIIIGGNIVSRGVTFENLSSMFFTRGVKGKMQQDTYIQRARMFGNRSKYLKYFELTIPEELYIDWHQCFLFHMLALASVKSNQDAPFWIESIGTRPVATGSIDRVNLQFNKKEMSFDLFGYDSEIEDIIKSEDNAFSKLRQIQMRIGKKALPQYLIDFVQNYSSAPEEIIIHPSSSIKSWKDADKDEISRPKGFGWFTVNSTTHLDADKDEISRPKGFIGKRDTNKDKYPHAKHHIKVYYHERKARVFYKYVAPERIKFLSVGKHE